MPLPSIHPLPPNPTTGYQPLASLGGTRSTLHPPPASTSGAGVSRETLKSLQDVYWSDDEVRALSWEWTNGERLGDVLSHAWQQHIEM